MTLAAMRFGFARGMCRALGTRSPIKPTTQIGFAVLIFFISFIAKSLHAVDLEPVMYTSLQPGLGMSSDYDRRAAWMAEGRGILFPDNQDPADTSLLVHPPGYYVFLAATYRLTGRSYFTVQFIQNAINSVSAILIFLIAGHLLSWRVGIASGLLAAASHHLSYYSNLILPDALCALPILIAVYVLVKARDRRAGSFRPYAAAGVVIGVSVWLRANAMVMGPFLAVILVLVTARRGRLVGRAAVFALASLITIAPITIRNYLIYGEFVPVQIGLGLNLWEGLGDASGGRLAATSDVEVSAQEAVLYGDARYGYSWNTPDGISRDRDRIKRSLEIILQRPLWFAGAMFWRMGQMVKYSAEAPLVFRSTDTKLLEAAAGLEVYDKPGRKAAASSGEGRQVQQPDRTVLLLGKSISLIRPVVRGLQRTAKETALLFILIGGALMLIAAWRRALFILMVPLYYFAFQSIIHTEFRFTLPMHYFLFIFGAVVWVLIVDAVGRGFRHVMGKGVGHFSS